MEYRGVDSVHHAATKQRRTKKRWVIATFPDSLEYNVIPTNWILKTLDGDGNTVVKCVWPPSSINVTSEDLTEAVEPSDDWKTYHIKLYENGSFRSAWHRQVELSEESATSEIDLQRIHKNIKNKRSMIPDEPDTSSDFSECYSIDLNDIKNKCFMIPVGSNIAIIWNLHILSLNKVSLNNIIDC